MLIPYTTHCRTVLMFYIVHLICVRPVPFFFVGADLAHAGGICKMP